MGMFDTITASCPKCGSSVHFQSKAGRCCLGRYDTDSVPTEIANSLNGESEQCDCGHMVTLHLPRNAPTFIQMEVT